MDHVQLSNCWHMKKAYFLMMRIILYKRGILHEHGVKKGSLFKEFIYILKAKSNFSFLNISILVLILSKWNIAISFQHFSSHNSRKM